MACDRHDIGRDRIMLTGLFAYRGYDWWWHSLTAVNRKTGTKKAFFFEFYLCNPALGEAKPVFGQLPENRAKRIKPSYLMVKAGCWGKGKRQLHRFFGWSEIKAEWSAPFSISADDCFVSEKELRGSIDIAPEEAADHPEWMCDAGSISWNLKLNKQIAFNVGYGANPIFCALEAFQMYWHAEGMKTAYSGTITFDGDIYDVSPRDCYGYADKNWGSNFTSPWVWLSSNNLVSNIYDKRLKNSAFEIGGGRPKIYFVPLDRKLLGVFYYEGKPYEFNFSKFWTGAKSDFDCTETDDELIWQVRMESRSAVMETEVRCRKSDMLFINYEAPDGSRRHNRLWNGGNAKGNVKLWKKTPSGLELIDDMRADNIGCEYGEYTK